MRLFMEPARKAAAVRRGLAAFFVAAGLLAVYASTSVLSRTVALMLGLPSIALGVGIALRWGLARWAALGTCFLMLLGAFALPLIIRVPISVGEFENPGRVEYLGWGFAGAFGLLGFWGLQYFRSPASKEEFGRSSDMRTAFERESPSVVVTSALVMFTFWLLPVGVVWSEQSGHGSSAPARGTRRPLPPEPAGEMQVERPEPAGPAPVSDAQGPPLPDLVVTDLCRRGDSMVHAILANRGNAGSSQKFVISYSGLRVGGGGGTSLARVPPAGTSGLVGLDRAINPNETETENLDVRLDVDATKQVDERNEGNNQVTIPIVFDYFYPGNLQPCPTLPEMNGR